MKGKMNLLQKLGISLVLVSAVLLLGSEWMAIRNRSALQELAARIIAGLPQISEGDPENYSDPAMPVLQLEGKDFAGLLQVPSFGIDLPIGSDWDRGAVSRYPCRFWGSVYDHSLIVGGSGQKGQFDFCGKLDLEERILVTDLTGARFSYEVFRIDRRSRADMETFRESEGDLILFARDGNSRDYIIVRCRFAPFSQ